MPATWPAEKAQSVGIEVDPQSYRARRVAEELGFTDAGRVGERLSFAEQQERKVERAFAMVERYENYAENAQSRGEGMQSEFKENAKDWSWVTQPNVNTWMYRFRKGGPSLQKRLLLTHLLTETCSRRLMLAVIV